MRRAVLWWSWCRWELAMRLCQRRTRRELARLLVAHREPGRGLAAVLDAVEDRGDRERTVELLRRVDLVGYRGLTLAGRLYQLLDDLGGGW